MLYSLSKSRAPIENVYLAWACMSKPYIFNLVQSAATAAIQRTQILQPNLSYNYVLNRLNMLLSMTLLWFWWKFIVEAGQAEGAREICTGFW